LLPGLCGGFGFAFKIFRFLPVPSLNFSFPGTPAVGFWHPATSRFLACSRRRLHPFLRPLAASLLLTPFPRKLWAGAFLFVPTQFTGLSRECRVVEGLCSFLKTPFRFVTRLSLMRVVPEIELVWRTPPQTIFPRRSFGNPLCGRLGFGPQFLLSPPCFFDEPF